ncbi:MAG: hypothetical protein V3S98_11285 [Dehalococcoidia bacterium]
MSTVMYAGTSEGVVTFKRENGKWEESARGLKDWAIGQLAVDPATPNRIYAGTRGDGVIVSDDYGEHWSKPNRGKTGPGKVKCVTISPHDSNVIYAGTEPIGIWVSRDQGSSWSEFESVWDVPSVPSIDYPVPSVEPHVRSIAIDPNDANTLYASLQVGYMIKSTDGGASWALVDKNVDADIHTVVLNPDDPKHIYVSTGGHDYRQGKSPGRSLYHSPDGGGSWLPMAMEFELEYSVPLTMHPKDPKLLYSALANGQPPQWAKQEGGAQATLIRSNDGGETWSAADTGFDEIAKDYVEIITFDMADSNKMYLGTRAGGLFESSDVGESWAKVDVPLKSITDLRIISG